MQVPTLPCKHNQGRHHVLDGNTSATQGLSGCLNGRHPFLHHIPGAHAENTLFTPCMVTLIRAAFLLLRLPLFLQTLACRES